MLAVKFIARLVIHFHLLFACTRMQAHTHARTQADILQDWLHATLSRHISLPPFTSFLVVLLLSFDVPLHTAVRSLAVSSVIIILIS